MTITYTKRRILLEGLSKEVVSYTAPLGYFLFSVADCFFRVLPPYKMLKKILLDGRLFDKDGNVLEWEPFQLTRLQYEELRKSLIKHPSWGGEVDDSFRGSSCYWQRWAILRLLQTETRYLQKF